mmetsp:Transcript_162/g.555  ORF Transcript_162/g.555 Transcript_162/m.555 type:complete len:262 (-) Transcript_162:57-842(-)
MISTTRRLRVVSAKRTVQQPPNIAASTVPRNAASLTRHTRAPRHTPCCAATRPARCASAGCAARCAAAAGSSPRSLASAAAPASIFWSRATDGADAGASPPRGPPRTASSSSVRRTGPFNFGGAGDSANAASSGGSTVRWVVRRTRESSAKRTVHQPPSATASTTPCRDGSLSRQTRSPTFKPRFFATSVLCGGAGDGENAASSDGSTARSVTRTLRVASANSTVQQPPGISASTVPRTAGSPLKQTRSPTRKPRFNSSDF